MLRCLSKPLLRQQAELTQSLQALPAAVTEGSKVVGRGLAGGRGSHQDDDDRTTGARRAAEDLMHAAQDSVRHAAEGNPGALAQDAASMASSAARGAYESAKLVADTLTGGMLGLGGQGQGERSETGKAFERVGSTLSDAGRSGGSAVQDATATMTDQAGLGMQQAATSLAGNMRQATGPESTYGEHVLRSSQVPHPEEASPEELREGALGGEWSGTPSETGASTRGTLYGVQITRDRGLTGSTEGVGTAGLGPPIVPEPGADVLKGVGEGGPTGSARVSERSFNDDEFAVTREEGGGVRGGHLGEAPQGQGL